MKFKGFVLIICMIFVLAGCVPSQFIKGEDTSASALTDEQFMKLAEQTESKKVTQLDEDTSPAADSLVMVVVDPSTTPTSKKASLENVFAGVAVDLASDAETITGTSTDKAVTPAGLTAACFHLTEIDSTDGDDAYTMQTTDIGGTITNQGDDDGLAITLLEASTWYTSNSKISCLTVMDVEGQTININPADGTDQIIWDGCAAGDSLDSSGTKGDLIKICPIGANEIAVFGAIGAWSDAD